MWTYYTLFTGFGEPSGIGTSSSHSFFYYITVNLQFMKNTNVLVTIFNGIKGMKRILLSLSFFLLTVSLFSQTNSYKQHTLTYDAVWSGKFRLKDSYGAVIKKDVKEPEMKILLADFPSGQNLYSEYLKKRNTARFLSMTSGGLAIIGLGCVFASLNYDQHHRGSPLKDETMYYAGMGLIGGGIVIGIVNIGVASSASVSAKRLTKAYNQYNSEKLTLQLGVTGNGVGLVLKF